MSYGPPPGDPDQPDPYGYGSQQPYGNGSQPGGPAGYGAPQQPQSTNGLAIGSLVAGIVSLVLLCACGLLSPLAAIPGLIMGFIGRKQVSQSQGRQTGSGMALAGIICSAISLVLIVAGVILWVALGYNETWMDSNQFDN